MSVEALRDFYSRAAPLLPLANDLRLALNSRDVTKSRTAAAALAAVTASWAQEIELHAEYRRQYAEWRIAHAVWEHGKRDINEPERPVWPASIPDDGIASEILGYIARLREDATGIQRKNEANPDLMFLGQSADWVVPSLVDYLGLMQKQIAEREERELDGDINRDQLAKLMGISGKRLANNPAWLPKPIDRTSKGIPIYRYRQALASLLEHYPKRAVMLPESYKDALSRVSDVSSPG